MKQRILLIVLLIAYGTATFAKQVDENIAQQIGRNFLAAKTNSQQLKAATTLQMVYKASSKNNNALASQQPRTLFYVLNAGSDGFVIVAGDDNVSPILGYSDEGTFDPDKVPQNVAKWLEGYKTEIRYVIDKDIQANQEITDEWQKLKSANIEAISATASVNPLIKTKWDQGTYYNSLCPDGSLTGCVATAMAQIMKYWNYPATGSGFHSYNHSTYGTLSANFGSTTYQWSSMPNVVNSSNNAVATLMYEVGVSVDMDYSPEGSSAYEICWDNAEDCSEYALKTYFGYKNTLQGVLKENYSQTEWLNLLKAELDAGRPILYGGDGNEGGHCFVADGYDSNNYIHFNWGWSGSCDGYFRIDALNPDGPGTPGYSNNQDAVIGIEPPTGTEETQNSLELAAEIIPSYNEISYFQAFTITTNIKNSGSNSFKGDYTAAIFDDSYKFVDYVEILKGYSLPAGHQYTNNLKFSTKGLGMIMSPGTYYIGIYYRPEGGNWIQVTSGAYADLVKMTVINPDDIELYSEMKIAPGMTLTQGQPVSVNLNIWNKGTNTFTGQYYVLLRSLDGTSIQSIGTYDENEGLQKGYTYLSPFLTFGATNVTVPPGTYFLEVLYNPKNTDDWSFVGSTDYKNPIKVTVIAPGLQPDIYESNNTIAQSFKLPVAFSGNNAMVTTSGSNCHITSDNDYYKIELPSGYQYTITPRLDDSSDKKNSYTLDGLFSYSLDGNNWSDAYDNVMTGNIIVEGGKTVYFHVAPYFVGQTGTYMLEMTITRTQSTGIVENLLADNIKVYPNPAKESVLIDFNDFTARLNQLTLINAQGVCVYETSLSDQPKTLHIPLVNLFEGIYILQLQTNNGVLNKKVIISK